MSKRSKVKNDGSFQTYSRSTQEVIDTMTLEVREVSFDAHFVTSKIIEFGKMLTGIPLYRYQEELAYRIIYSVVSLEGATITALKSRQCGKTETLAFVVDSLSVLLPALATIFEDLEQFKDGLKIGLYAPQSDQVYNTYNRALMRLGTENAQMIMGDPDLEVSLVKTGKYHLTNGSEMIGQVASKQSKIEGQTHHIVICEEAQDMDSFIVQKSIEPMVSAVNGTIVKIGTTGTQKNDFWNDIQYNKNKSRGCKDPRLVTHYEANYKRIFEDKRYQYEKDKKVFHLMYEKDVRTKMEKWGRDSQAFKLSFALEWDLDSGMLVSDKEFNKICNRKKGLYNFTDEDIIIAGMDIGKDIASTVITIGKIVWNPNDEGEPPKKEIIGWVDLAGLDYDAQHYKIVDTIEEFNISSLYADYTGVGKPLIDRLDAAVGDDVAISPYPFSQSSKSDMWYNLLEHLHQGRLILPANKQAQATQEWQNFQEQLLNCQKWFNGSYLCAEKADGFLDDYVDSLGLMLLADSFEVQEEVEVEEYNPFFSKTMDHRRFVKSLNH